ncbi:MAG: GNAT family N-acetyltransferase [Novosphingobium sp.]|nr:GNAT family N-acetyltransferase [Novosphingobium sp.]
MEHAQIDVKTSVAIAAFERPPDHARDELVNPLAEAWRKCESAASLPTQCHAFVASLADTMLADAEWEFVGTADTAGGDALLPLCRDRGYFARWRMAGAREVFEPGDGLCGTPEAAVALAAALASDSRPLCFARMPADSLLIPALRGALRGRGWLSVRPAVPCPTIALDETWAEPEAHFNSGRRSDFRRAARRAQQMGAVAYEVLSPSEAEFDRLFDEAIAVELESWKRAAGTAMAVDRAKEEFFRAYFRRTARLGQLRIAFLRIDGRAVAMQLALEWHGRFWLFKIGYDEAYAKCSPGTLLMLHTLGWAARRGLAGYELLGGVEPWIAAFWTRDGRPCVQLRSYPLGLRGAIALLSDASSTLVKRVRRRFG